MDKDNTIRFRASGQLAADLDQRARESKTTPALQAKRDLCEFYKLIRRCGFDPTDLEINQEKI